MIPEKVLPRLPENLVFLGYRGSQAHGTFVPNTNPNSIDDFDLMGVFVAPIEHYFGFGRNEVVESFPDEYDTVCYELRKFIDLLRKNNPNVLSMLWLEEESILHKSHAWLYIVKHRDLFISKLAYHSFTGYAYAQLKKMTAFNKKEQNRLTSIQQQIESFGIPFIDGIPKMRAGEVPLAIELVRQYNEVRSKYFSGYMGEKRKNNVLRFGYDTKNAAHLIRLLYMCYEFLETGKFVVKHPEAQLYIDIKQGKYPLKQIQLDANNMFEDIKRRFDKCTFPERPDKEKIEKLLVGILEECFYPGHLNF